MRNVTAITTAVVVAALTLWSLMGTQGRMSPSPASAAVTPSGDELSVWMSQMQRHAHKLGLAVDAGNGPLAGFYADELIETSDLIMKKFPQYDNFQVGALMKAMLSPSLDAMKKASADAATASAMFDKVVVACNGCHVATQHGFVKITRVKTNPFNQNFAK